MDIADRRRNIEAAEGVIADVIDALEKTLGEKVTGVTYWPGPKDVDFSRVRITSRRMEP